VRIGDGENQVDSNHVRVFPFLIGPLESKGTESTDEIGPGDR